MVALGIVVVVVAGCAAVVLLVAGLRETARAEWLDERAGVVVDLGARRQAARRTAAAGDDVSQYVAEDGVNDYPNFI